MSRRAVGLLISTQAWTASAAEAPAPSAPSHTEPLLSHTEPLTLASLRVAAGLGGDVSDVYAARLGFELDVWLSEGIGVGALATNQLQIYRFEAARSYWLLAPVLALRNEARGTYSFASAAAGWVAWSCSPGPCEDEGERGRNTFGGSLAAGRVWHYDGLGIGVQLALDAVGSHVPSGTVNLTATLNLVLGLALQEPAAGADAAAPAAVEAP